MSKYDELLGKPFVQCEVRLRDGREVVIRHFFRHVLLDSITKNPDEYVSVVVLSTDEFESVRYKEIDPESIIEESAM